jgi:hypothetical protein
MIENQIIGTWRLVSFESRVWMTKSVIQWGGMPQVASYTALMDACQCRS